MLSVKLVGDRELIAKLDAIPGSLRHRLLQVTTRLALKLEGRVKDQKLSGQVLNVVTGALRRSITEEVSSTSTMVRGRVYSAGDVKYAAIHEFGGKTPAHEIVAKNGKALAFMMGGKQVFATRVQHPGSTMPERSYLRSSLGEMRREIEDAYADAVREGVALK